MTRKHFEVVADILKRNNASETLVQEFAQYLQDQNPRFNYPRFVKAATSSNQPFECPECGQLCIADFDDPEQWVCVCGLCWPRNASKV